MRKQQATYDIQKAYKRMQGLQHVTSELSKAFTRQQVAKVIINEGFSVLGARSGDIVLKSKENDPIYVIAHKGYRKTLLNQIDAKKPPLLTDLVIQTKEPIYIKEFDDLEEKYFFAKKFFKETNASSAALLPLLVNDLVMGVMQFTFEKPQVFTIDDKEFMQTLAYQCAQAFERVAAIENLKKSKGELEVILKNISDGIIVRNESGELLYTNRTSTLLHDSTKHEMENESFVEHANRYTLFDELGQVVPKEQYPFNRALAGEKNPCLIAKTVIDGNKIKWLRITSTTITNVNEHSKLVITVIHDMTREKELEQRKDDFISMASHELKTPLTTLKVFAQVLKKKLSDKDADTLFEKMDDQVNRLNALVTELLDITRIQQGRLGVHRRPFLLQELIRDIVEDLQPITKHTIELRMQKTRQVLADRDRIGQVVTNFINNAIKYSPSSNKIVASTVEKGDELIFSVQDFGIGIAEEEQAKVFDRFYRTEEEEKTYPGLGLGLYISSEIIKQHGGKIWVKSKIGKGSTFFFSLPL